VGNLVGFLDGLGVGLAVGFSVGFTVGLSLGLSLLSLGYSVGEEVISIKFEPGLATGILTTGTGTTGTTIGGRVGYLRTVGRRVGARKAESVVVAEPVGLWKAFPGLFFEICWIGAAVGWFHDVPDPGLAAF